MYYMTFKCPWPTHGKLRTQSRVRVIICQGQRRKLPRSTSHWARSLSKVTLARWRYLPRAKWPNLAILLGRSSVHNFCFKVIVLLCQGQDVSVSRSKWFCLVVNVLQRNQRRYWAKTNIPELCFRTRRVIQDFHTPRAFWIIVQVQPNNSGISQTIMQYWLTLFDQPG